jgi:Flp pilus assembly pilin Flp
VRKLGRTVWAFLQAEEAMATTEYAVMVALIICLCMGPVQALGCQASFAFLRTSRSIGS